MPGDVFHHDDGVVDQDAYGEDEREQADAVDRVAHQVRGKESKQDRGRDDDQRHHCLSPADYKPDQQHNRDGREREVKQQLVCLVVRGLAVITRDLDIDIAGNEPAFQASACWISCSATTTAFAPGRLAKATLTAGAVDQAFLPRRVSDQT